MVCRAFVLLLAGVACVTAESNSTHLNATELTASNAHPEQIKLALAGRDALGNPTGMTFAWFTWKNVASVVMYGKSPSNLTSTATGSSQTYLLFSGHHHSVKVVGLHPGTRYYYKVGDGKVWSDVRSFTTAPGDTTKPFSMSIFGDMGWLGSKERPMVLTVDGLVKHWDAKPTKRQLDRLQKEGAIDLMWVVGDVGYADDAFAHDVVGGMYEKCQNGWGNWMENLASAMPFMVLPGNHESECHSPLCVVDRIHGKKLANFTAYNKRYHMPSQESGGVQSMWYSFNYGPVHFVAMNTETDFPGAGEENKGDSGIFPAGHFAPNGEYLRWLEADLKAASEARAKKTPGYRSFIVAGGHRPCCSPGSVGPGVQELFEKYGVDLYVSGHRHTYARSLRACAPPGCTPSKKGAMGNTTYIYVGGAGNDETTFVDHGPNATKGAVTFATAEHSSGVLKVVNSTAMQWTLLSSIDGRAIDQFWITRP